MLTLLAAVAVLVGIVAAASVALLAWAQYRQALYRCRLAAAPMHVHEDANGRKRRCHGVSCRPVWVDEVAA